MVESSEGDADSFWARVIEKTLRGGYTGNSSLVVPKHRRSGEPTPHPSDATGVLVHHIGELKGQVADWRGSIEGREEGFHAVEYEDRYECHIDSKDPFKDPLGHLAQDSPGTLAAIAIGGIAAAALTGAALYYSKKRKEEQTE